MLSLALVLLLAGPSALFQWNEEPDGYRGVKWGAPLADATSVIGTGWNGKTADCTCVAVSKTARAGTCSARPESDPRMIPAERACVSFHDVGGVKVRERWLFRDDRFMGVSWTFDPERFEALRDVLIDKYGLAEEVTEGDLQTRLGATVHNQTLTWAGAKATVEISRFGKTIEDGHAALVCHEYVAEQARIKEENKQAGAKSF